MTMIDTEQTGRTTTSYHYVLTLTAQEAGAIRQVTQDGTFTITDGAGVTRAQVLAQATESTRQDNGIRADAPVNVVFWSLKPNEL